MAPFHYVAVNKDGEKLEGDVDVRTENDVRINLRSQGLRPLKILKKGTPAEILSSGNLTKFFGSGISDEDLLLFTRQLAILMNSGIPLIQGLEIIMAQTEKIAVKNMIQTIKDKVSAGSFLWESMKSFGETFPPLYISMIQAGESSGALDSILRRLMRYLEDHIKLKKTVKAAMIYPIAVSFVGMGVIFVMLNFVIPKFEAMLTQGGQELPDVTRFVIDASHFCSQHVGTILGSVFLAVFLTWRYLKTEEGGKFFDTLGLRLPLIGGLVRKISVARFSRTLQTMLASGISLLDSLEICRGAVGNFVYSELIAKVRSEVSGGKSLSLILSKEPLFPNMMTQMVNVGESTGNLDQMLERVADFYEEEVSATVAQLTKLLEPLVLIVLGGMVAGLMVAMYLPMFKMAG